MKKLTDFLENVRTMGIAGHVRPDGDCVGSCMGLYLYMKENFPQIHTEIFLEPPKPVFGYIESMEEVQSVCDEKKKFDLFVTLDVSSLDRIGAAGKCFENAEKTLCIDHHVSNQGFADINYISGDISSASEVLYGLLEPDKISLACATAIYTGMSHDTGVFQYSATTGDTMRIAGSLMDKGVDFNRIVVESFYEKTYVQNQIMGRVLAESIMLLDGKCIVGAVRKRDMDFYGVDGKDLDGIVSQLRLTKDIEVAIFIYELEIQLFKVSMRSGGSVDVSKVAAYFGGGGHVRAAGCDMHGSIYDVMNNLSRQIEKQMLAENVL